MTRKKSLFYEAATLILVAHGDATNKFQDITRNVIKRSAPKVLMVQRSSQSSFMPSAGVFPGGRTDKVDFSPEWKDIYTQKVSWQSILDSLPKSCDPRPPIYTRVIKDVILPSDIGFRICAIRETFEESGLLLLRNNPDGAFINNPAAQYASCITLTLSELQKWRKIIRQDASQFLRLCRELEAVPDIWSLHDWSNWFTPAGYSKRFDTAFFLCCLKNTKDLINDSDSEVRKSFWSKPSEVLRYHVNKELFLYPPQIHELSRLLNFETVQELLSFSHHRPRNHSTLQYLTVPIKCKNGTITVLSGDSLYPMDKRPIRENILVPEDEIWYGELINREEDTIEQLNASSTHLHRYVFPNFMEPFSKLKESSVSIVPYANTRLLDGHKPLQLSWL
ncbi:uncharacterized protein TRIADDRAFT_59075 [Trichoplax adhaerens]|uniref:Nudix hydrolase domain-containing protein n=1 Tax=Trichoplax adhaerens TaxID=10228 RepID=B3S4G4_TRIAD|nr:hypothetical protein TRIADDRAFT_59075 [Trichoplax adhaerens]EDV22459.1 hypothetical protein TRIADDRAFT_59075 [Trichoplax adhaerens]|eukprot:XP_002115003.1 hypothetical protein TRIADDRAFT_59075 [Trichoplax adhaerens]